MSDEEPVVVVCEPGLWVWVRRFGRLVASASAMGVYLTESHAAPVWIPAQDMSNIDDMSPRGYQPLGCTMSPRRREALAWALGIIRGES